MIPELFDDDQLKSLQMLTGWDHGDKLLNRSYYLVLKGNCLVRSVFEVCRTAIATGFFGDALMIFMIMGPASLFHSISFKALFCLPKKAEGF